MPAGRHGSPCEDKSVRAGWCDAKEQAPFGTVCVNILPWEVQMPACGQSGPFLVSGGSCAFSEEFGCVVVIKDAVVETHTAACR